MKRWSFVAVLATLVSLFPLSAYAQGRVAVLNIEEAILRTEEAKARFSALEQTPSFQENKKKAEGLDKEYRTLAEQFNKNREVLSQEQQAEQARKIQDIRTDLEFVAKKLQQSQQEVAQKVMGEIGPRAKTVIEELVKTEGIGLLVSAQAVLYADTGYNITAKVTDKLNQLKK